MRKFFLFAGIGFVLVSMARAEITVLHEFGPSGDPDGRSPQYARLVVYNYTIYGMTYYGGVSNKGVIYSIGTNGSNFQILHRFGTSDLGFRPRGPLVRIGSTLYGMGGAYSTTDGTVFSIGTDGTNAQRLHRFGSFVGDGEAPMGGLTVDGSTLYGMTNQGGSYSGGTVFSMSADGTNYSILHHFQDGVSTNGKSPVGSMILDGATLYGITQYGGANGRGSIFSIGTDGSGLEAH